jgi:hypothetical protein
MSQAFFSFLTGLFYTGGLFLLCLFTVVGAKSLLLPKRTATKREKQPQKEPQTVTKTKPRPIKSIEINPDEIDRIYVKKSS